MPAFLKLDAEKDVLYVVIGGMQKSEFQDALARTRSIPGARYNPNGAPEPGRDGPTKRWELPNTPEVAARAMRSLEPVAAPEVQAMLRDHAAMVAGDLVTRVGDDADLQTQQMVSLPADIKGVKGVTDTEDAAIFGMLRDFLRPYQRAGIDFMARHKHALLADEMGLGKTVQSIGTALEMLARDKDAFDGREGILVVCPKVLRRTWAEEIEKWAPGTKVQLLDHRTAAGRLKQLETPANAYIINWESMWRDPIHKALLKRKWAAIFADEAHRAKNRKAKQTKGLWKLHAPLQIALTGTPIMNTPDELWPILKWLKPEQYTSFWQFHEKYVDEYPGYRGNVFIGVKEPDALRFELSELMVRRTKELVLTDLPPKSRQVLPVDMTPEASKLYDQTNDALILDIAAFVELQADEAEEAAEGEDFNREQFVQALTNSYASMPLDKLVGEVPNTAARIGKLRQITSAVKVAAAEELIGDNPDKPFVCFTWYRDSARLLADSLRGSGFRVGTIVGDDDPDPVKDAFQAGDIDIVVATIAKGGVGLTLTRADTAIFVDEDWVPAINEQAEDRLHRIGQENAVTITVLRVPGSVDEQKVGRANDFKRRVVSSVLGNPATQEIK